MPVLFLLLSSGAFVFLAGDVIRLQTGIATLDDLTIRARVAIYSVLYGVDARVIMAIIHNESGGSVYNFLGDASIGNGPSIGPMQVSRQTAIDLGLWENPGDDDGREAFAALSGDIGLGIRWGCAVFKDKLDNTGGDVSSAIQAYNGSGVAAVAYASNAKTFLKNTYGMNV